MPPLKALIFDADGTKLDSIGAFRKSFAAALNTINVTVEEIQINQVVGRGIPLDKCFEALAPPGHNIDQLQAIYREQFDQHVHLIKAFPQVIETLDELKKRKIRLGVVSTRLKSVQKTLALVNIHHNEIIIDGSFQPHKPAPNGIIKCLKQFGIKAKDAAYIGDTPSDMFAAKAAGVTAIGVAWSIDLAELKAANPDHIIQSFNELLNFV